MNKNSTLESRYARNLIEATLDPLITINIDGIIMDVNEAMENATDKKRQILIGTNIVEYFIEKEKAHEVFNEVFANGFALNFPLTIIDGVLTDVLINGSIYKDKQGLVLGAVIVARDITHLKKIEKELTEAKLSAELATKIAMEEKGKAEDAMQAKQQFLSNMSHEIRTPMNAIIGFTKVISKTNLSTKQKEYIDAIRTSGDALVVLINDILDLAKVNAGKMTFEQVPFRMLSSISAMLHLFETKIEEKNLKLVKEYDCKIPKVLLGDPVRLHQIILNLVSNALKFTVTGTLTVGVKLLSEDLEKVTIEFSITDTGIGIQQKNLGNIFENFQQASNGTSRLYGGTGLGLAIVKQLVELQGGSISVESKIDEGSRFSVILSFLKTNNEIKSEIISEFPNGDVDDIHVLIVEDIALNQLLMKTILNDFGFTHETAENGKVAIEKINNEQFDIILMDLQMPEMNGFEATSYIRNILNSKIPIIALTADVTTVDLAKCKSVGMNDYISKPVDETILYNKIVELIQNPTFLKTKDKPTGGIKPHENLKFVDLSYLTHRTKSDPSLMMEIISLYLDQTPSLIDSMKKGLLEKDWNALQVSVHKMIPSFSLMGISKDFESMAKKVQEHTDNIQKEMDGIPNLVIQLERVCLQACNELEEEFKSIKSKFELNKVDYLKN